MEAIDHSLMQGQGMTTRYGGFWIRFGALIIDGLILAPLTLGVVYFNVVTAKSPLIFAFISLVGIIYKPLLESMYGATWGKMALKLKVVNKNLEKPELKQILIRNVFYVVPSLIIMLLTVGIYTDERMTDVDGYMEYSMLVGQLVAVQVINVFSGLITIVDAIVLVSDSQKRSLHDRLAGTFVVEVD